MSLYYSEQKDEKILWSLDDNNDKLVKICGTKEDVSDDIKNLLPRLGLDTQRKKENFILPRIVTHDMRFIPCIKISDDTLELAFLNE